MTANNNSIVASNQKSAAVQTAMQKVQTAYMDSIIRQGEQMHIHYDAEQVACGNALLSAMTEQMEAKSLAIKDMDQTKLIRVIQEATLLRLNANANPKECYVIVRAPRDKKPYFDFGIMGDGYDKILRRYGVGVKNVHPFWAVREKDTFTYPSFNGLTVQPPTWAPKDMTSKVVRVVYPIEMTDGSVVWEIAEREDVKKNLLAHIGQNLMYDSKHPGLIDRISEMSLDEIFKDKEALEVMSPAWKSPQSRESMILRKMRNNAIKAMPKDFGNAFVAGAFEDASDGTINVEDVVDAEVTESVATEKIDAPKIDKETGEIQTKSTKAEEVSKPERKADPAARQAAVSEEEPF